MSTCEINWGEQRTLLVWKSKVTWFNPPIAICTFSIRMCLPNKPFKFSSHHTHKSQGSTQNNLEKLRQKSPWWVSSLMQLSQPMSDQTLCSTTTAYHNRGFAVLLCSFFPRDKRAERKHLLMFQTSWWLGVLVSPGCHAGIGGRVVQY